MWEILGREPLRQYEFTAEHLRRVRVDKRPPRFFVGNADARVAYWRTNQSDGVRVETIAFFHSKKTGDVRIMFIDGQFAIWTHEGAPGKPMSADELEYLGRILTLVSGFAP